MTKEQEPAAWAVWSRQSGCLAASVRREDAVDMQSEFEVYTDIVPLYLSSPLTDTEREAILFCVSCAQDYRDTLDGSEERATQMIETAMRFAMPPVGPAPVEGPRTASVTDVGGAGPTLADEEREAIEMAIRRERGEWYGNPDYMRAITLRGLLERTRNG